MTRAETFERRIERQTAIVGTQLRRLRFERLLLDRMLARRTGPSASVDGVTESADRLTLTEVVARAQARAAWIEESRSMRLLRPTGSPPL